MARQPKDPFILLFKKITRNPVVWDEPYSKAQAWIWMLMQARTTDNGTLLAGEFTATLEQLSRTWGWYDRFKVRRFLDKLKSEKMIDVRLVAPRASAQGLAQKTHKVSTIKILNFQDYQGGAAQKTHKKRTANSTLNNQDNKNKINQEYVPPSEVASATPLKPVSDSRRVSDYMWESYRAQYGFKPQVTPKAFFKNLAKIVDEYGVGKIIAAWDLYLADKREFCVENGHSPQTFLAGGVLTKYLAKTTTNQDPNWWDK